MTRLYSPFDAHPGQQWSNLIRPRPSTQTDTRVSASPLPGAPRTNSASRSAPSRVGSFPVVEVPLFAHTPAESVSEEISATNSPKPVVIVQVRMRLDKQHIQFRTLPQSDASPSPAAGNWREQFKRVLRCLAAPALFSRGPFGRNHNSLGLLARWSSKPLFHLRQEPSSGIAYAFHLLVGLVGLHADQSDRDVNAACAKNQSNRSKKL